VKPVVNAQGVRRMMVPKSQKKKKKASEGKSYQFNTVKRMMPREKKKRIAVITRKVPKKKGQRWKRGNTDG